MSEAGALQKGMEAKSKEFVENGAEADFVSTTTPSAPAIATPAATPAVAPAAAKTPSEIAAEYFGQFHTQCEDVFKTSLTEPNLAKIAVSHRFAPELALWCELVGSRREMELSRVAGHEYEYSLLALAQGHYRHAFKSLRLVLELTLQAVFLSANELRLREWLGRVFKISSGSV